MVKGKLLNALAVLASMFGYLEWGGGNSTFLFQGEWEVLRRLTTDPLSAAHPFTLVPLLGQVLLIVTLFQKEPSKWLTYAGLACIGLLLLLITFIGIIRVNYKILISMIPFIVTAVLAIIETRKK
jgi:hypothetical protein